MAIRERAGRASPYQVYWNNPWTGKRESANFATREEALKHDSLIKHRLKFERESFKRKENEEKSEIITLEEAYMLYLRERQFSKGNLGRQISAFRVILSRYGNTGLEAFTKDLLLEIKEMVLQKAPSQTTAHKWMSILRSILNWASGQGLCEINFFPALPSLHYKRFIPPSMDELTKMLAAAQPHITRVIILGSQCGVRVGPSEMFNLTWRDVDLDRGVLRVYGAKKNLSCPWREVPIKRAIMDLFYKLKIEDMASRIDHLIHYHAKPVTCIKKAWKKMLQNAGITRQIRPYDLRHAFATELIAAGADIGTIAKLMGHSSPTMILNHYQYVMDKQKQFAIESLPDIFHVSKNMCPSKKGLHELT